MAEIISGKPYHDANGLRVFDIDKGQEEYVWHRDETDREIEVLSGQGWQLQFDKCLPFLLQEGDSYFIPMMEYHRLIKGATPLIIRIINSNN